MADLRSLVGAHKLISCARTDVRHPFNADRHGIAWELDDKVYFVFEDNNDGYRSAAGPMLVAEGSAYEFWEPEYIHRDVVVKLVEHDEYGPANIIEIIDVKTGHVWLRVGTTNIDDYYPSFVADWFPLPPASEKPGE